MSSKARTILSWSFLVLLARARICASWLNRMIDIEVLRFPMVFKGFGVAEALAAVLSDPYKLTRPVFELWIPVSTVI